MTPDSVVKLNSGWDAFFSVYTQIMPLPCFMKSYVPYPTANKSLYFGFHTNAVT